MSSRRKPSRPNGIVFDRPELIVNAPGPITEFGGESPKQVTDTTNAGSLNAAVLNHSCTVGFARAELPFWSARSELTPGTFWQDGFFEKTRTVKGVPECAVNVLFNRHAPKISFSQPFRAKCCRSPNGNWYVKLP